MRLGFACEWSRSPEKTWSGTPWGARTALGRQTQVVDLGLEYTAARKLWRYAYARRRRGRWMSVYQWSRRSDRTIQRKLQNSLRHNPVDAVIEVADLAPLDAPFYVYQDLSFDVLMQHYDTVEGVPGFDGIDRSTIERRRERQREIYDSAAGIFAMSDWFAEELVEHSGIPREKVHVVYAGLNSVEAGDHAEPEVESQDSDRLLFVGRDFFRKGGEQVVAALARLRREHSPGLRLTVVGPESWPLAGEIPEGVDFLGGRSTAEVARLYREHDLFVMPSRFEAFGIVIREALANGLPVIGRSAFAMPEVIIPGKNGALVSGDGSDELAAAIVSVLESPEIRGYAARDAENMRERFSWDTVAGRMIGAISGSA